MHRRHARRALPLLAATTLLVVSACGADDDASSAPEPARTSAAAPTASSATDAVEPATGPVVTTRQFRVHLPDDYVLEPRHGYTQLAHARQGGDLIGVAVTPAFGQTDLDQVARVTMRTAVADPPPAREDDVELDGVPAFHALSDGRYTVHHIYGTARGGQVVSLEFMLDATTPPAQRTALVESVLATWEWR